VDLTRPLSKDLSIQMKVNGRPRKVREFRAIIASAYDREDGMRRPFLSE